MYADSLIFGFGAMSKGKGQSSLTVEAVFDLRRDAHAQPIRAEGFFATLSEAEWSALRKAASQTGKTDNPALRCGDCRRAVYARESRKGRRHAYHFAGDHSGCRWSGAVAGHVRAIDADKFRGQQEGEQHRTLRELTAEVLAFDPKTRAGGIYHHRYTKLEDGRYTYPDVFAKFWQDAQAVFEIQLATTHLPIITRREQFYRDAEIRLIWLIGYHEKGPMRRAFRDIYMDNDGQILGMDGEVAEAAREAKEPRFRLYRLLPDPPNKGFAPRWRNRIVTPGEIDWGGCGDRPRSAQGSYDHYLDTMIARDDRLSSLRDQFYASLEGTDETVVGAAWDQVRQITGGMLWRDLPDRYDTMRVLGVLATLRLNRICVQANISMKDLPNLVNSMLLEPEKRRAWTKAFERLCQATDRQGLLATESVADKCNRNLAASAGTTSPDQQAGPVFDALFPEGAFQRMTLAEG